MIAISHINDLSKSDLTKIFNRFGEDFNSILTESVIPIIKNVKKNGDSSVVDYSEKFDGVILDSIIADTDEIKKKAALISKEILEALEKAYKNIYEFHEKQKRENIEYVRSDGSKLGLVFRPIENSALYVPGGKASYPSTVLMGSAPAKIAGVKNLTLITPPGPDGKLLPVIAAAAKISGVDTIVKAGGAHGVAAAGLGTESVKKCDLIVGPGNIYVTAAKSYLFSLGLIQIDSMAGPSEVLIIADESANAKWTAWDLLSQAEHDERAESILVTTSKSFAEKVNNYIKEDIDSKRGRHEIKKAALANSKIVITESIDDAIKFSNQYAPEHMQMLVDNSENYLPLIKNVGSLFLGHYSPVAVGDFYSGTNHILPTGGAARFSSGVSVETFQHRMTYQNISKDALREYMPYTNRIATVEGFDDKHGDSIRIRFEK
jgi:histidinol dehydrogenase